MNNPRKIELLLIEGTPFGLRYADIKTRTIRAFICPRASFKDLLKRQELDNSGVYILFNRSADSDLPQVYIGEADVLKDRLPHHNAKDFWTEIIVFVAQDETLNKAAVRYIESMLVSRAKQDKLAQLENGNTPAIKNISEADEAVMTEFIEDIVFLLSVLGYKIIRSKFSQTEEKAATVLFAKGVGVEAKGKETDEGFIVFEGSQARLEQTKSVSKYEIEARKKLLDLGVLELRDQYYIFTQDYVFTNPSLAAGVVFGRRCNGRTEWKTKSGETLKQIQEKGI